MQKEEGQPNSVTVIEEVSVSGSWDIESDYHFMEFEVSCNIPLTIPLFPLFLYLFQVFFIELYLSVVYTGHKKAKKPC